MNHARRRVVVAVTAAGLLALPAPAAAAEPATAVFADDPVRGVRTFDAAGTAAVSAELTSDLNAFSVRASDGPVTYDLTVTTTVPLGPGTFQTGPAVRLAVSGCGTVAGTLTIAELVRDGAALAALGASYDGTCGGSRYLGTVRYRSAEPWWGAHAPAVAFPDTLVGRPTTRDATVAATGTQPVTLGAATVTAPYSVTADGCAGRTLQPGESCALTVRYAPTSAGWSAPTLTVPSDGPRGAVRVALSGNALYPPLPP